MQGSTWRQTRAAVQRTAVRHGCWEQLLTVEASIGGAEGVGEVLALLARNLRAMDRDRRAAFVLRIARRTE